MNIRNANENDLRTLSSSLRVADLKEIQAFSGEDPENALIQSLRASTLCKVVEDSAGIVGVFGIGPHNESPYVGVPWCMGSEALTKHPLWFIRTSQEWKKKFHEMFPILWNLVDGRNVVHVNWLRRMGFKFIGERPIRNVTFLEFTSCVPPQRQSRSPSLSAVK